MRGAIACRVRIYARVFCRKCRGLAPVRASERVLAGIMQREFVVIAGRDCRTVAGQPGRGVARDGIADLRDLRGIAGGNSFHQNDLRGYRRQSAGALCYGMTSVAGFQELAMGAPLRARAR